MAASERPSFNSILLGERYLVEIIPAPQFSSYSKFIYLSKEEYETGLVPYAQGYKTLREALPHFCPDTLDLIFTGLDPVENPESAE